MGDFGRLRQILLNLLSNAVKFTERGEVVVTAIGETHGDGRSCLNVDVRDTGIGIPHGPDGPALPVVQPGRLLDRAALRRHGPWPRHQPAPGRGDGRLADRGEQRRRRQGLDVPPAGPRCPRHQHPRCPRRTRSCRVELAGKRALIVDDNATNRRILDAQLARWEIEAKDTAVAAGGARRGSRRVEHFDVGLLDLFMPDIDGIALAEQIRAMPAAAHMRLVLVSSAAMREHRQTVFDALLAKPVKPSALHDTLVDVLAAPE